MKHCFRPAIVKLLIEKGANLHAMNVSGRTPLEVARGEDGDDSNTKVIKLLEQATNSNTLGLRR
jgi:ankyrin repeat protein